MIPEARLKQILGRRDQANSLKWSRDHKYKETWEVIDGAVVIYNGFTPPSWLKPVLLAVDKDGSTGEMGVAEAFNHEKVS